MSKCVICGKDAIFKVKNEKVYYCKIHAEEFFSIDCLENIQKINKSVKQANILEEYLNHYKNQNITKNKKKSQKK